MVKANMPSSNPYPLLESPILVPKVKGFQVPLKGSSDVAPLKYPRETKQPSPFPDMPALSGLPLKSFSKSTCPLVVSLTQWITIFCMEATEITGNARSGKMMLPIETAEQTDGSLKKEDKM